MRDGVIIDCGRQEGGAHPKEDDDWWLDLYVMLSRATRLEDLEGPRTIGHNLNLCACPAQSMMRDVKIRNVVIDHEHAHPLQ